MGYEEIRFEGIIDVGIIVITHCENPAKNDALNFFTKVLKLETPCIIPASAILGAYHIMTKYLRVKSEEAKNALTNTLDLKYSIFYEDIGIKLVKTALELARDFKIESWDRYIISVMKKLKIGTIYTLDVEDFSKINEIKVRCPIPEESYDEYIKWLKNKT